MYTDRKRVTSNYIKTDIEDYTVETYYTNYLNKHKIDNNMENKERSNTLFAKILSLSLILVALVIILSYYINTKKVSNKGLIWNRETVIDYKNFKIHQLLYAVEDSTNRDSSYGVITNVVYNNCSSGCVPYISEIRTWYRSNVLIYKDEQLNCAKKIIDNGK